MKLIISGRLYKDKTIYDFIKEFDSGKLGLVDSLYWERTTAIVKIDTMCWKHEQQATIAEAEKWIIHPEIEVIE